MEIGIKQKRNVSHFILLKIIKNWSFYEQNFLKEIFLRDRINITFWVWFSNQVLNISKIKNNLKQVIHTNKVYRFCKLFLILRVL